MAKLNLGRIVLDLPDVTGRPGELFGGIGSVTGLTPGGELALRDPRRPILPEVRSPDGQQFHRFEIENLNSTDGGYDLTLRGRHTLTGPMEYMLHECRPRYRTGDWSQDDAPAPNTRLTWELRPMRRQFGPVEYEGFAMRYRFASESMAIYKILDRATWELGGQAVGNTIVMRNGTVASIFEVKNPTDRYCTEWFLPGIQQPNIFQFFPLQTQLQGFTFTSGPGGKLVTWTPQLAHVRTLLEKASTSNVICHWHELCDDLSDHFTTPWMEVLFAPGQPESAVDLVNEWEHVRASVWDHLHHAAGMTEEKVRPYGVIEEWQDADLDCYREKGIPALDALGIKRIFLANHFENNMNQWGVSNMCCTTDWRIATRVGEEKFAAFCREAQGREIDVEMWGNTAISTFEFILNMRDGAPKNIEYPDENTTLPRRLSRMKDPYIRNLFGGIEADHYTPVFCALNFRDDEVAELWHERWNALRPYGLNGIFVDSSFNMSSDKHHYVQNAAGHGHGATIDQSHLLGATRPATDPPAAVLTQYPAYLRMIARMQQDGFHICGEDCGVFGTNRSGPGTDLRVPYLSLWMDSYCTFNPREIRELGQDPNDVFFRGLAYRVMWNVYWVPQLETVSFRHGGSHSPDDDVTPWHGDLLRTYSRALPTMGARHILPNEIGVRYDESSNSILWTFAEMAWPPDWNGRVTNLATGQVLGPQQPLTKHGVFRHEPIA